MRILILSTIFLTALTYFYSYQKRSSNGDVLKLKMSSFARPQVAFKPKSLDGQKEETPVVALVESNSDTPSPENDEEEEEIDEDYAQDGVPWEMIENEWKNEMREVLSRLSPEHGEEILSNYQAEQETYRQEIDSLVKEKEELRKAGDEKASREYDQLIEQLYEKHQLALKEIFGEHFDDIKAHHSEYNSSIQHYNRSDYSISIEL